VPVGIITRSACALVLRIEQRSSGTAPELEGA
jgi:hypothetical protein